MTASVHIGNAPLKKLLPKTPSKLKVIHATRDSVIVDDIGIHSTVSIDRVTLVPYNG